MQQRTYATTQAESGRRRARTLALPRLCVIAFLGVAATSCAHGQAKTIAELPPLAMPEAPPRVVEPAEPQPPAVVALPDEPRTNLPRPAPAQRPDSPRAAEPAKTDPATSTATEPARPPEETPRANAPTTLQTTPTQREGEVERRVRILIAQAMNDLNRVNYQALNADARNQYDTAKRFAIQAEEAVRARNLVFASNLADKAAALAAQLLGR
jgi:hypothetical protein